MNNEDINYNEIKISGIINNITDTNDKYIKYGLTSFKYTLNGKSNICPVCHNEELSDGEFCKICGTYIV